MSIIKRGRPNGTGQFQNKSLKKALISVLKKCGGITNAQRFLLTNGIILTGKRRKKIMVSLPTLIKIANDANLRFQRGRPKLAV